MNLPVIKVFKEKEGIKYFITKQKQKRNWLLVPSILALPLVYIPFL